MSVRRQFVDRKRPRALEEVCVKVAPDMEGSRTSEAPSNWTALLRRLIGPAFERAKSRCQRECVVVSQDEITRDPCRQSVCEGSRPLSFATFSSSPLLSSLRLAVPLGLAYSGDLEPPLTASKVSMGLRGHLVALRWRLDCSDSPTSKEPG